MTLCALCQTAQQQAQPHTQQQRRKPSHASGACVCVCLAVCYLCTTEVGGGDGFEALLASGVPYLEPDGLALNGHRLDLKVNANGCDERGAEAVVSVAQQQACLADS